MDRSRWVAAIILGLILGVVVFVSFFSDTPPKVARSSKPNGQGESSDRRPPEDPKPQDPPKRDVKNPPGDPDIREVVQPPPPVLPSRPSPEEALPAVPACRSENPAEDFVRIGRDLRAPGGRAAGLASLETVLGCERGKYAMIVARVFDPTNEDTSIPPDTQRAIRYFTLAVLQGRKEGLEALVKIKESVEGDPALKRQLDARISALQNK